MYRKLDAFKVPTVKARIGHRRRACKRAKRHMKQFGIKEESDGTGKIAWIGYVQHGHRLKKGIDQLRGTPGTLYWQLSEKLSARGISKQASPSILDIYEVVRTLVMASNDSAIIGWIQYHWSQMRLARSTLVPSALLVVLLPACMVQWGIQMWRIGLTLLLLIFFLALQVAHYYYRERFMIYAMVGYFLTADEPGSAVKAKSAATCV